MDQDADPGLEYETIDFAGAPLYYPELLAAMKRRREKVGDAWHPYVLRCHSETRRFLPVALGHAVPSWMPLPVVALYTDLGPIVVLYADEYGPGVVEISDRFDLEPFVVMKNFSLTSADYYWQR